MKYQPLWAKRITGYTLVGFSPEEFPANHGNCFSVETKDRKEFKIVNFGLENLEELTKRGLKWLVRIQPISEHHAAICDERIGSRWYFNRFCEVCTPRELLPAPQRMEHFMQMERGERTEHPDGGISMTFVCSAQFP